jgi:membrane protein DedA with SNARE-associated domain
MDDLAQPLLEFIRTHQDWAVAVIFLVAFGESMAFVSLLFPGSMLLVAAGTLMRAGALPWLPVTAGAILGAVLGDFVSYWIGRRLGGRAARLWPLTRYPKLLPAGIRFFERHGGKSVFIGRFFGPLRAVINLAAGMMRMSPGRFALPAITSALVWGPALLLLGNTFGELGHRAFGSANTVMLVFVGLALLGIVAGAWAAVRAARHGN